MKVDQGKLAKQKGAMKARDAKHYDQDPARLPPHKKPKVWKLTIEWVETKTVRRNQEFTSKAARDESRRRIERYMKEQAEKLAMKSKRRGYWWGNESAFAGYWEAEIVTLKEGPNYTEYYGDAQPVADSEKQS
jgi:hypothetical protein